MFPFKRFFINFHENLKCYIPNISIHGLCNIFKTPIILEKIFWVVIFLFGVQYFYGMLYENLIGFYNQPVTRTIATTAYPISFVPFPAVTICNFNVVYKSYTKNIEKLLLDNGINQDLIQTFFQHLSLLRTPSSTVDVNQYKDIYRILNSNGYSNKTKLMLELAQPCAEMLTSCSWAGTDVNCKDIFQTAKADFGFCCSFNSDLDPVPQGNKEYYTSAGPLQGLAVRLNIEEHEYASATYNLTGILVIVHNKNTYANSDYLFYTVVQPGTEAAMKIIPDIFEAEKELNQIPPDARNCWLENEGAQFLKLNYSFYNCMHMCKSEAIATSCKCIPHFHRDYDNLRTCNLLDMSCLIQNYENFTALHVLSNKKAHSEQGEIMCECLPPCTGINYVGTTEILYFKDKDGVLLPNYSGVRVFFQNNFCTKYTLSRSVTPESFIALIGGLFALCLGGSILSVSELIYYIFKSIFENSNKRDLGKEPSLYWAEFRVFEKRHANNTTNIFIK